MVIRILILLLCASVVFGQTSDIDRGCIPLEVNFTGPELANYYWDFGDLTSSNLQNPTHIYTSAGEFEAKLFDDNGGSLIGTIDITVYPDLEITILADTTEGCIPLEVNFDVEVIHHPEITITGYRWIFGDGVSASEESIAHIYTQSGVFDVSVEVTTNLLECDQILTSEDLIKTSRLNAAFNLNYSAECELPTTVTFENNTAHEDGTSYFWNLGNGTTSSNQFPDPINFTESGSFPVSLFVEDENGCSTTLFDTIYTGEKTEVIFDPPDTICIDELAVFIGDTACIHHEWILPNDLLNPNVGDPLIVTARFEEPGEKLFTYLCYYTPNCVLDSTFSIYVELPNANFTFDPPIGCADVQTPTLIAEENHYVTYFWNGQATESPTYTDTIICPSQDSFYANRELAIPYSLSVVSQAGCTAYEEKFYRNAKPNACFLAAPNNGCAPLEVSFIDITESVFDVNYWQWDLGDGTIIEQNEADELTHIYTEPGEYYAKLIIENIEGCRDTSFGTWITIGVPVEAEFVFDEQVICAGDSITGALISADERLDSWYLAGGNGITSLCGNDFYEVTSIPGSYNPIIMTEYNGCYNTIQLTDSLHIIGPYAELHYRIDCTTPFIVSFWSDGSVGDAISWLIEGEEVSNAASFDYTFEQTGDYEVTLITQNGEGCDPALDIDSIHIRSLTASLTGPEIACPGEVVTFDASGSTDVDTDSYSGYRYYSRAIRTHVTDIDTFDWIFPPGEHIMYLEVTDMNGCTAVDSLTLNVPELEVGFSLSHDSLCIPGEVQLINSSFAELGIANYSWVSGEVFLEDIWEPELVLTSIPEDSVLTITLSIEDEFGCSASVSQSYDYFDFAIDIGVVGSAKVCLGDEISLFVRFEDIQEEDCNCVWSMGDGTTQLGSSITHIYEQAGDYTVTLDCFHTENGCIRSSTIEASAYALPIAAFSTSVDSLDPICHPEIIDFTDLSTTDGTVIYTWFMGEEDEVRFIKEPSFTFPKGTHEVTLLIESIYGCMDTTSTDFTLVGPEGEIILDVDSICLGDPIMLELINQVDVNTFTWDLGDGTLAENANPVEHIYSFVPQTGNTIIKCILKSELNGCEHIVEQPININTIEAELRIEASDAFCGLSVILEGLSEQADSFLWEFSDGSVNTGSEVIHEFTTEGVIGIVMKAINTASGCFTEVTNEVVIEALDKGFLMPNVFTPNGDDTNDFFFPVPIGLDSEAIEIVEFKIYNRWGNLIYDNTDPQNGWDGNFDGKPVDSEVYAYFISIQVADCGLQTKQGNITLIR